jgi:hypothetical protein
MPATEYYLELPGNLHIAVTSDTEVPLTVKDELLLGAYLPGVRILDETPRQTDITLHHIESAERGFRQGNDELELRDKWSGELSADVPHLLYSVARTEWLKRGYYPVHAACVGLNNFVLLPAASGMGKSTTVLETVMTYGHYIVSGNSSLVEVHDDGKMNVIAGTRTMTLKIEDFEKGGYAYEKRANYGDRTAFTQPSTCYEDEQVDVDLVALIRLSQTMRKWVDLSPLQALHTLYPLFLNEESRDCIVADGAGLYLGDTPIESRQNLARGLSQAVNKIRAVEAMGNAGYLASNIAQS